MYKIMCISVKKKIGISNTFGLTGEAKENEQIIKQKDQKLFH